MPQAFDLAGITCPFFAFFAKNGASSEEMVHKRSLKVGIAARCRAIIRAVRLGSFGFKFEVSVLIKS